MSKPSDLSELDAHDALVFAEDEDYLLEDDVLDCEESSETTTTWTVVIVDDEPAVHQATQLALNNFSFEGKALKFLSAYSGEEGKKLLSEHHSETAFVLLDVVMETHDAGLNVVQYIREELNNRKVRIILRTGNPGDAPETSVILNYDINDYTLKVELTRQRLLTTVITALRSYRDVITIDQQRQELVQTLAHLEKVQQQLTAYSHELEIKVSERTIALERANQELQRLAFLDGLTEIANRRYFDDYLSQQWQILSQAQQPLALILADVDLFKNYNDIYGHQSGDACLKQVAQTLDKALKRPMDLAARFGGEEFAIILPYTELKGAEQIAKVILTAVRALALPHQASSVSEWVTVSMGLSGILPQAGLSPETLIATADQALYQAKQTGRDRYRIYQPSPNLKLTDSNFSVPTNRCLPEG
ncbi:MAG: diguanylate cyclase [Leptolyngbya sp. SIO3F4]|nr:diguanylate cyclase [Leptolyngbya sp. SIO3F4]